MKNINGQSGKTDKLNKTPVNNVKRVVFTDELSALEDAQRKQFWAICFSIAQKKGILGTSESYKLSKMFNISEQRCEKALIWCLKVVAQKQQSETEQIKEAVSEAEKNRCDEKRCEEQSNQKEVKIVQTDLFTPIVKTKLVKPKLVNLETEISEVNEVKKNNYFIASEETQEFIETCTKLLNEPKIIGSESLKKLIEDLRQSVIENGGYSERQEEILYNLEFPKYERWDEASEIYELSLEGMRDASEGARERLDEWGDRYQVLSD